MANVTKDTTVGEIIRKYSNGAEVLLGFGMHCFGCPVSQMESVGDAAAVHGIDVGFMLTKLNAELKEGKSAHIYKPKPAAKKATAVKVKSKK